MKKFICAALLVLSSSSHAFMINGNKFLEFDRGFQLGYVAMMVDTQMETCIPNGVTIGNLTDVVTEFIQNASAAEKIGNASLLVKVAMMKTFHCNTFVYNIGERPKPFDKMSHMDMLTRPVSSNPNINKQKQ
jgi:hypothetical protein